MSFSYARREKGSFVPRAPRLYIERMKNRKGNSFETKFWQKAYDSLPAPVRAANLKHMQDAEQWELALGRLIEMIARVKGVIFHTPSRTQRAH
jgi:hypothetical protein